MRGTGRNSLEFIRPFFFLRETNLSIRGPLVRALYIPFDYSTNEKKNCNSEAQPEQKEPSGYIFWIPRKAGHFAQGVQCKSEVVGTYCIARQDQWKPPKKVDPNPLPIPHRRQNNKKDMEHNEDVGGPDGGATGAHFMEVTGRWTRKEVGTSSFKGWLDPLTQPLTQSFPAARPVSARDQAVWQGMEERGGYGEDADGRSNADACTGVL